MWEGASPLPHLPSAHTEKLFKAPMKRYEKFADDIAELIRSGVLGPGQRVPSVRYASQTYGVSPSTVFQAYYLLERRGLIRARPRSGYFVNTHAPSPFSEPVISSHVNDSTEV